MDADRLDEHVRRHQHQAGNAPPRGGRVDERNGGAVRVPDQQRVRDAELVEQSGQNIQRLLVHEARRARAREPVGLAVAEARVDERGCAEADGDLVREVAPQCH
jgi:hypothetical protein